ncbi:mitochondrial pyruvate dehydrogenase complex, E1 component, alpha subunit, partial [Haematococcus lacustris]
MSEDLPVIVIAGNPNSNDYSANRVLHHTTGSPDFNQQLRAFKEVTCAQVSITHVEEAARLIDFALSTALAQRKPALI